VLAYHRTYQAAVILRDGFRDTTGTYMTPQEWTGVWVSADWPLDENEGAGGDTVIEIDIPDELLTTYEWVEDGKPYREALIPAAELNRHPRRILSDDELDELSDRRWDVS
jgi:hypothetical protein